VYPQIRKVKISDKMKILKKIIKEDKQYFKTSFNTDSKSKSKVKEDEKEKKVKDMHVQTQEVKLERNGLTNGYKIKKKINA